MESAGFSETLGSVYYTAWFHVL